MGITTTTAKSSEMIKYLNMLSSAQVADHQPVSYIVDLLAEYQDEAFYNVLDNPTLEQFNDHIREQCDYYMIYGDYAKQAVDDGEYETMSDANDEAHRLRTLNMRVLKHYQHVYAIYHINRLSTGV